MNDLCHSCAFKGIEGIGSHDCVCMILVTCVIVVPLRTSMTCVIFVSLRTSVTYAMLCPLRTSVASKVAEVMAVSVVTSVTCTDSVNLAFFSSSFLLL